MHRNTLLALVTKEEKKKKKRQEPIIKANTKRSDKDGAIGRKKRSGSFWKSGGGEERGRATAVPLFMLWTQPPSLPRRLGFVILLVTGWLSLGEGG